MLVVPGAVVVVDVVADEVVVAVEVGAETVLVVGAMLVVVGTLARELPEPKPAASRWAVMLIDLPDAST